MLLLLLLVSPVVTGLSAQSLIVHHLAHWSIVGAGALLGYQVRDRLRLPFPAAAAWAGAAVALLWHVPPALALTDVSTAVHVVAHGSLLAGGAGIGYGLPRMAGPGRAALFIFTVVLMWPVVLAEMTGAFTYARYPGQEVATGVVETAAMAAAWLGVAFWGQLRRLASRPALVRPVQVAMAGLVVLDWLAR